MRCFLAKRLLQGALSSARSGRPCATAGAGSPFRPVFSSSRCYAVAASLSQEEAETVTFPSPSTGEILGLGSQASNGFLVADVDGSSLIICGKAFPDADSEKNALSALGLLLLVIRWFCCLPPKIPLRAAVIFMGISYQQMLVLSYLLMVSHLSSKLEMLGHQTC